MKKIFYSLLAIILIASSACKKDTVKVPPKAFEDITFQDIKAFESKMTYQDVEVRKDGVVKAERVILFLNNYFYYGKMKIISISQNNVLTFDLVLYNPDGSVKLNKPGATVENTWFFDFVTGVQVGGIGSEDFYFIKLNDANDMSIFPFPINYFYTYSN
jgi:hypothetical protein